MIARLKKLVTSCLRWLVMCLLYPLEVALCYRYSKTATAPPIFIVGPPRSGTTLLYQLLIANYRFSYFSNLSHRFYKTPISTYWLTHRLVSSKPTDLTSTFGTTNGWFSANEGGWIWQRFWRDSDWKSEQDLGNIPVLKLRSLTNAMSAIGQAPFLNKNVMHSNKIRLLNHIFPGCLFIQINRDLEDNARSIIKAQCTSGGPRLNQNNWWSVQPKHSKLYFNASIAEKAVYQILAVARDIERDANHIGKARLCAVSYTDLCDFPKRELKKIEEFLSSYGLTLLEKKPNYSEKLTVSTGSKLDVNLEDELNIAIKVVNVDEV